jgi:radical SAM superfamily enzyme YgiQ (UPF0313 family)
MEVALVQCPSWTTESPPYALALLAASLRSHGHSVRCFDLNIELFKFCRENVKKEDCIINGESWCMDSRGDVWYNSDNVFNFVNKYGDFVNRLVDAIVGSPARVIGFSMQSTSKFFSLEIARRVKQKDRNKIIVCGGPLVFRNCYGVDILKDFPFLDIACFDEGEFSFPRVIAELEKNGAISIDPFPGYGYRVRDGKIIDSGRDDLIRDLDAFPFADYSYFSLGDYAKSLLPIATSRGCINQCTFCSESAHWRGYRRRSAANIMQEIEWQKGKYPHVHSFWFNDSTINGDIRMLNELSDCLISQQAGIAWGGQGMIRPEMNKAFLQKLKLSGCNVISYGIESGSNRILRLMRKRYTADLAERVVRETAEAGIRVIFNIIVGFPGETEGDFKETKDFVSRCKKFSEHIELPVYLLLKGSYIYEHLDEFNITPLSESDPDWQAQWSTKDNQNTYALRRKRLEELIAIRDQ